MEHLLWVAKTSDFGAMDGPLLNWTKAFFLFIYMDF